MQPESRTPGSSFHDRHTVLLVDDADDLREAVAMFLRVQGCEVADAADAPSALAMLRDGLRPCLTLVDLTLPGMDGWQLVEAIRAEPAVAALPLAILTGDGRHVRRARALELPVLVKPPELDELCPLVQRYCRHGR